MPQLEIFPSPLKLVLFIVLSFILHTLPVVGSDSITQYGDQSSLQADQHFLSHRLVGQPNVDKFRLRAELNQFILSEPEDLHGESLSLSNSHFDLQSFGSFDSHFTFSISSQAPPLA